MSRPSVFTITAKYRCHTTVQIAASSSSLSLSSPRLARAKRAHKAFTTHHAGMNVPIKK